MREYPPKPEKVYFFGTCLIDMIYPNIGIAGIRLLQKAGLQVVFPQGQTCCGQPAFNSGFFKETRSVALKQMEIFDKNYPIVVPSGSCAGMMHLHYPELFEHTPYSEQSKKFSNRVFELSEFLVHVAKIRLEDRGQPVKVTWHSSCHAQREMKIIDNCKKLLRQLKNVELVELQRENECCGFGGTFAIKQPKISAAMVRDKVADIQETGANILLAENCGCLMNITGNADYQKLPIKGKHIAEFIWERING